MTRRSLNEDTNWRRRAVRWVDTFMARLPSRPTPVVILGFWRSGTTVAMEQIAAEIGARSFFEPLHYSVPDAQAMHPPITFEVNGKTFTQWIPFQHPGETHEGLQRLISAALAGSLSTAWTRRRRGLRESFTRRTVVKFVRANLLGAWIQRTFDVTPIWVARHPGAVLASIMRPSGGMPALRATLGDPRLLRWVVEQDGVARHFPELTRMAGGRDEPASTEDTILRLWMVTHWIPWRLAQEGEWSPTVLPYSRIVRGPGDMRGLLDHLGQGRSSSRRSQPAADSSTTKKERRGASAEARLHGWRTELPAKVQEGLDRLGRSFGEDFQSWIDSLSA